LNINVVWHKEGLELAIEKKSVSIVIDVLRGSTTIVALKAIESSKIISFESRQDALRAYDSVNNENEKKKTLLIGEKKGLMELGFHFCNSPTQIMKNSNFIKNKTIFFKSTNLSKVLNSYKKGLSTFIGSIVNCSAVTEKAYDIANKNGQDIMLIPVGRFLRFYKQKEDEDEIATIFMIRRFLRFKGIKLFKPASDLYEKFENISDADLLKKITITKSALYLKNIGFGDDVVFSSKIDFFKNIVPVLDTNDNILIL
jgi:phosphosulfolactate phosphohydrolase-like enzyme